MVRVGDCDKDVEDIDEQEFSIKAVHFHPENNVGAYLNNDLAVVRLSSRVSHLLPFPRPGVHHLELGQHRPGQWRLLQETPGRQGAHPSGIYLSIGWPAGQQCRPRRGQMVEAWAVDVQMQASISSIKL